MKQRPSALVVLGVLAIVVGGLRACAGFSTVTNYLQGEDAFRGAVAREAERMPSAPWLAPEQRERLGSEQAAVQWSWRGVAVPMGVMNVILAVLLSLGAARALAGSSWGHGAWEWSAKLNLPYTVLSTVMWVMQIRDLTQSTGRVMGGAAPDLAVSAAAALLQTAAIAVGLVLSGLYVACWIYLRRPHIRALFPSETEGRT